MHCTKLTLVARVIPLINGSIHNTFSIKINSESLVNFQLFVDILNEIYQQKLIIFFINEKKNLDFVHILFILE